MSTVSYMLPKSDRPLHLRNMETCHAMAESEVSIPLLGNIAAGLPLDLYPTQDAIPVPASMVRKGSYALKVVGDSMIEDHIQDGDIIVVQETTTAENGQSVVAMINGDSVTLKRFFVEKHGIRLQPANASMQPIFIKNEDVKILGVVTGVIRNC